MADADWFDSLRNAVAEAGFETHTLVAGDGRLLVTTHAARLLACEAPGLSGNALWHNPALESPATAAGPLHAAGGELGGDRLWIAPEVGFIFTDLKAARKNPLEHEALPPEMDPAAWEVLLAGEDGLSLQTAMTLVDHRSDKRVALDVARSWGVLETPGELPPGVGHVGFFTRNTIELSEGDDGTVAGAWDILQVPPTGTLHCPTTVAGVNPRSYYDPFGDRHVHADDRGVRFLIDGRRRVKMGILPEHTTGRMAFYRPATDADRTLAILRLFDPQPGQPYIDLPRASDEVFGGDCLQAYNHIEGLGDFPPFGEMEYHDPAIFVGGGPTRREGACQTHVLTGPDAAVRQAVEPLLGMPLQSLA